MADGKWQMANAADAQNTPVQTGCTFRTKKYMTVTIINKDTLLCHYVILKRVSASRTGFRLLRLTHPDASQPPARGASLPPFRAK